MPVSQVLDYCVHSQRRNIDFAPMDLKQKFEAFLLHFLPQSHSKELKILEAVQLNFASLGIDPHRPLNPNLFFVSAAILWSHFSNCMYLFHVASTFQEFTLSINSTSTTTLFILVYGIFVWKEQKVLGFISRLELLVLRNTMFKETIDKTTVLVEKWCKIIFFLVLQLFPPGTMLPVLIVSFLVYFNTGSGQTAFQLPLAMWYAWTKLSLFPILIFIWRILFDFNWRYPFDWKTPKGYLCAFALQYIIVIKGFAFGACCALFAIGSFMYLIMATKIAKSIVNSMNEAAKIKKNRPKVIHHLTDFMIFHGTMKR